MENTIAVKRWITYDGDGHYLWSSEPTHRSEHGWVGDIGSCLNLCYDSRKIIAPIIEVIPEFRGIVEIEITVTRVGTLGEVVQTCPTKWRP